MVGQRLTIFAPYSYPPHRRVAALFLVAGKPIPLDSFLFTTCQPLGAFKGRKRWRSADGGKYYEWDATHGEIEVYNRRGRHLGVLNAHGLLIKDAVPGRTIPL